MKLPEAEETLMHHLWEAKKAFMKDLLDAYPEPKPAVTTVATLLKRMTTKGFVNYKTFGNSREYFPVIKKDDYFSTHIKGLIKNFFGDSSSQFASFFTTKTQLTEAELIELREIIDSQIEKKQS